jgi:hypothetical protein
MKFKKIITDKDLPPANKYVIGKHNRGTWIDSDDQKNVNTVIVKLVKGISMDQRAKLNYNDPRKRHYMSADEWGNNYRAYNWQTFGSDEFFGQSITHWCEIPEIEE